MVCDDRGRATFTDDADIGKPGADEQVGYGACTAVDFVTAGRVGPHRWDADQVLEIGSHGGQRGQNTVDKIAHGFHPA
jgi:hypothetical protein